jgi:iron complex transport system ATP-binding protein
MAVLHATNLAIGYKKKVGHNVIQHGLNLELAPGELVCLIGPNGAGKSTLLRTLGALQRPLGGTVQVDDEDVHSLDQHEKSLKLSLVLTDRFEMERTTVCDLVSMGRYPHLSWWGTIHDEDKRIIDETIEAVHLSAKKHCNLQELSDGERQRAMIARAFVQNTPIVLLDEPTAHLDLPNRVEIMLLLHKLAHTTGKAILLSTHELDLALQAADKIWLMSVEHGVECGVPEDLVFDGSFDRVFKSSAFFFNTSNGNFSLNYKLSKYVSVWGDKMRMYWTLRALARGGYMVVNDAKINIEVTQESWIINGIQQDTVAQLLDYLSSCNF